MRCDVPDCERASAQEDRREVVFCEERGGDVLRGGGGRGDVELERRGRGRRGVEGAAAGDRESGRGGGVDDGHDCGCACVQGGLISG